jgi:hypothetical protein
VQRHGGVGFEVDGGADESRRRRRQCVNNDGKNVYKQLEDKLEEFIEVGKESPESKRVGDSEGI